LGETPAIRSLREQIAIAAPSNGRVLILGDNGTGKELVARAIHAQSRRAAQPFVEVNCAAIPEELIESELFGHTRGAFTGATASKRGKFELADGGTLFLDEIGDMSLKTQAKVLRALQEGRIEPVGGSGGIDVDVRVITATNKNLEEELRAGRFREDLYYRLNVVPLRVPPLCERREDIAPLANHFLQHYGREYGRPAKQLEPAVLEALGAYQWPGNVRELRNMMERFMITVLGPVIALSDLPAALRQPVLRDSSDRIDLGPLKQAREQFEAGYIRRALELCRGNVSQVARRLGIERSHLYRKLRAYGLLPNRETPASMAVTSAEATPLPLGERQR
jgi:two-component system nitrogen regulation response regulator NtrX